MTPRIDLPCSYDDCPQWWKNLVINTNGDNIDGRINRDEIFKRYHATAIKNTIKLVVFHILSLKVKNIRLGSYLTYIAMKISNDYNTTIRR